MNQIKISFTTILIVLSFSLLAKILPCIGEVVARGDDDTSAQHRIMEWIRSNGGHFSEKQEFRRAIIPGDDDSSTYFGIFATKDIKKDDLLCSVPWKCVITGRNLKKKDKINPYFFCGSTRVLIDEIRKGEESFFEPYVSYLMDQSRGVIPSDWSNAGKELLNELLGGERSKNQLPPSDAVSLIEIWENSCYESDENGFPNRSLKQQALVEYHTRADDEALVPLYDLYNHAQDEKSNGVTEVFWGEKQDVRANRDILQGEEISMSYNFAIHQNTWTKKYYGTPEFLRDYGFVEPLPQRWTFTEQGFGFDLKKDDSTGGDGIELTWLKQPDGEAYLSLTQQLERLRFAFKPRLDSIEKTIEEGKPAGSDADIPSPEELKTIRQYFEAMKTAISKAIDVVDAADSHDDNNDDDDWDDDEQVEEEGDEHYFNEL